MNVNKICMHCMQEQLNENGVCSACSTDENTIEITKKHLPMRTILKGKYLVGRVIGEGGFGITYVGYDLDLEIKVAIKEFCPGSISGREMSDSVTIMPFGAREKEIYEEEKEKFINEAKRLAKFRKLEGVVSVLDYFKENNTAYIVMDYIEGVTLKHYCKMLNAPMQWDKLLELMRPVLKALNEIHKAGIIHRDISADNIMISKDEKSVYLIDFGTARALAQGTLSAYEKDFYTPWEQTSETMEQGPWTDVYALCATLYYCMTGKRLPRVSDRHGNEQIVLPSQQGLPVPAHVEAALVEGLALHPNNRIRSMIELEQKLYGGLNVGQEELGRVVHEIEVPASPQTVVRQDVVAVGDGFKALEELREMGIVRKRWETVTTVACFILFFGFCIPWIFGVFGYLEEIGTCLFVCGIGLAILCAILLKVVQKNSKKEDAIWDCLFSLENCGDISYICAQIKWLKSVKERKGYILSDYSYANTGLRSKNFFNALYELVSVSNTIPENVKTEWLDLASRTFPLLSIEKK